MQASARPLRGLCRPFIEAARPSATGSHVGDPSEPIAILRCADDALMVASINRALLIAGNCLYGSRYLWLFAHLRRETMPTPVSIELIDRNHRLHSVPRIQHPTKIRPPRNILGSGGIARTRLRSNGQKRRAERIGLTRLHETRGRFPKSVYRPISAAQAHWRSPARPPIHAHAISRRTLGSGRPRITYSFYATEPRERFAERWTKNGREGRGSGERTKGDEPRGARLAASHSLVIRAAFHS